MVDPICDDEGPARYTAFIKELVRMCRPWLDWRRRLLSPMVERSPNARDQAGVKWETTVNGMT